MEKKISYLSRSFDDIRKELISFSKKYYPELSDNFNDASVGAWLIDMMSAVGDDLSYHTDRMYQETNIDSASSKHTILNNARMNGVKIPGPKPSVCEIELSCVLGVNPENISSPNWKQAPVIKRGGVVGNTNYSFELAEDVDFAEQFNSDGFSNRKFTPIKNSNGNITGYKVSKTVIGVSGTSKVYKKVLSETELSPFMEIILPEQNVMNIESIIFKETANFNTDPQIYEYYIDEEEYKVRDEAISTYRYFEVDSLADQYRFGSVTNWSDKDELKVNYTKPEVYTDYDVNGAVTRYFEGVWKPISQKFITEYTDNGYLKVIFGSGTDSAELPIGGDLYGESVMSRIINNKMLGILPRAGWSMFILYRIGGGVDANLGSGAINKVLNVNVTFPELNSDDVTIKNDIIKSLTVTNLTSAVGGKDMPSAEEMKYIVKYTIPSQKRCVTLKDYKSTIMQIPPKYGCPFRCNVLEANNKIIIPVLWLNPNKQLDDALPMTVASNISEYIRQYKNITDFVEFRSGKIYHLGFGVDVFISKNYVTADVISAIINKIKDYFDINKHDMGEDIFVGDLEKEINMLDGVISIIDLRIYKIFGGTYSQTPCPLPTINQSSVCNVIDATFEVEEGATASQIDLNAVDSVLYSDYDSMYEIKNIDTDVKVRVKLR